MIRFTSDTAMIPDRRLLSGSRTDFDKNLIIYSQNPVYYSCQDAD
jgi:hypothetical protein